MRRILIVLMLAGPAACATSGGPFAFLHPRHKPTPAAVATIAPAPPPVLADGLWAILDPGCPKPNATNVRAWPKCASPFWINRGKVLVVRTASGRTHALTDASYAADYRLDGGDPLIAQVGAEKDGYLFLALTDLSEDGRGRLVGAIGAAVACPKPLSGSVSVKPSLNGCDAQSMDDVRKAAVLTLQDRTALTEVAWIAPGAP